MRTSIHLWVINIRIVIDDEGYRSLHLTCQQTFDEIDHLNEIYAGGQVVPPDFKCTVAGILEHNWNWERYRLEHRSELEDFQIDQIEKMFACQKRDLGGKLYACSCCGETKHVSFTCMSRICSHCEQMPRKSKMIHAAEIEKGFV